MGRIWNRDVRVSRETFFSRMSVRDGMKWGGTLLACRRSYHQQDIESGRVAHCPKCWDEVLKQVRNSRCPECFGTGYEGGYMPVETIWGLILENEQQDDLTETAGLAQSQNMTVKLPCEPIFRDGDMFAEVRRSIGGRILELGRIMRIDGPVKRTTIQGWTSNNTNDRETVVEDMVVSQEATAKLMLPSDVSYAMSEKFWGLEADPYIEDGHVCAPGASYDDYARIVDGRHVKVPWGGLL